MCTGGIDVEDLLTSGIQAELVCKQRPAEGRVIAAGIWGKFKTAVQMVMAVVLIADIPGLEILEQILIYAGLVLTLISLFDYLMSNKDVLKEYGETIDLGLFVVFFSLQENLSIVVI